MCMEHVMRLRPDPRFPVEHSSHLQMARDCVVTSSVFIVQKKFPFAKRGMTKDLRFAWCRNKWQ